MIFEAILIGTMTVTSYRAIPAQTKPDCTDRGHCVTSINENVSELGCAVSQDLLRTGRIKYRDVLYIPGFGYRIVNDTMHSRIRRHIDLFVYTKKEERHVGTRHIQVWKVGHHD